MKRIRVTAIEQVGEILDYVHDRSFDLDKIDFDKDQQTLVLHLSTWLHDKSKAEIWFFGLYARWRCPTVAVELISRNVVEYKLEDDAGIGTGMINTISQEGNQLVVECSYGPSVMLSLNVTACDIECVVSDEIIGEEQETAIAFLLYTTTARTDFGYSQLHRAALMDDKDTAEMLIETGADLNARADDGSTPLHFAGYYGSENIAKILIDAGADVNAKDGRNRTPRYMAEIEGHEKVAKIFAEAGGHRTYTLWWLIRKIWQR